MAMLDEAAPRTKQTLSCEKHTHQKTKHQPDWVKMRCDAEQGGSSGVRISHSSPCPRPLARPALVGGRNLFLDIPRFEGSGVAGIRVLCPAKHRSGVDGITIDLTTYDGRSPDGVTICMYAGTETDLVLD